MTPTEQQVEAVMQAILPQCERFGEHAVIIALSLAEKAVYALSITPAQVPGGEPVAWMYRSGERFQHTRVVQTRWIHVTPNWTETPLYAHPAPAAAPADGEVAWMDRAAAVLLRAEVAFYKEREREFARMLGVCDGDQYRADWEAPIRNMVARATAAEARVTEAVAAEREAIAAMLDAEAAELSVYRDHWPQRDELRKMAERIRARAAHDTSDDAARETLACGQGTETAP